ncbi:MAG TPA: DUF559 domain-containing protein, partial [Aestuariivirgaceae bacterium]|nr:DUF559 domain-containing protein [Aestuariivirgaceae bacterium]
MIEKDSKPTEWTIKPKLRSRARSLGRDLTDAEHVIWKAVRAHRLNGMSFRRQTPVGPYIVDFVCHDAMLILEIDGGQHFDVKQEAYDQRRDEYQGFAWGLGIDRLAML